MFSCLIILLFWCVVEKGRLTSPVGLFVVLFVSFNVVFFFFLTCSDEKLLCPIKQYCIIAQSSAVIVILLNRSVKASSHQSGLLHPVAVQMLWHACWSGMICSTGSLWFYYINVPYIYIMYLFVCLYICLLFSVQYKLSSIAQKYLWHAWK